MCIRDSGRSELSTKYNNYFGIKAKSGGVELETKEYENVVEKSVLDPFKKYDSKKDSFKDYARLISTADRYKKVLEAKDYKEAITLIKACGYATDPNYASKVIEIIENYNLTELDSCLLYTSSVTPFVVVPRNNLNHVAHYVG